MKTLTITDKKAMASILAASGPFSSQSQMTLDGYDEKTCIFGEKTIRVFLDENELVAIEIDEDEEEGAGLIKITQPEVIRDLFHAANADGKMASMIKRKHDHSAWSIDAEINGDSCRFYFKVMASSSAIKFTPENCVAVIFGDQLPETL